jgi:hypothetical protein
MASVGLLCELLVDPRPVYLYDKLDESRYDILLATNRKGDDDPRQHGNSSDSSAPRMSGPRSARGVKTTGDEAIKGSPLHAILPFCSPS